MKTALQEFIDNVIPMHIIELDMIKQEIKKALQKEKEQIMNAYIDGFDETAFAISGINYYNQTYNQNK
jgi:hypothetical protein